MDFYKLDKIDKIFISVVLIIVTMFCILNNFVFASDIDFVDYNVVNGIGIYVNGGVVAGSSGDSIGYFEIEPGYVYTIRRSDNYSFKCGFSNSVPEIGVELYDIQPSVSSYTFESNDFNYFYFNFGIADTEYIVTRDYPMSFDGAIFNLFENVNGLLIWNAFESVIPFILVCSVFGLGTVFIHRLIKSGSKGKAKLF